MQFLSSTFKHLNVKTKISKFVEPCAPKFTTGNTLFKEVDRFYGNVRIINSTDIDQYDIQINSYGSNSYNEKNSSKSNKLLSEVRKLRSNIYRKTQIIWTQLIQKTQEI